MSNIDTSDTAEPPHRAIDMTAYVRLALRALLVPVVIVSVVLALLVGRIIWRPLDVSFLQPILEDALNASDDDMHLDLGALSLNWSHKLGSVYVRAQQSVMYDDQGHILARFNDTALSPSWRHLLQMRFKPRVIILQKPSLKVERDASGRFHFGIMHDKAQVSDSSPLDAAALESAPASAIAENKTVLERILLAFGRLEPGSDNPLSALQRFELQQAQLSVEDAQLGTAWTVPLVDVVFVASADAGLRADFSVYLDISSDQKNAVHGRVVLPLDHAENTKMSLRFQDLSSRYILDKIPDLPRAAQQDIRLNGRVSAQLRPDMNLALANVDMVSSEGALRLPLYPDWQTYYKDLRLVARYDVQKGLSVQDLSLELEGVKLSADADFQPRFSEQGGAYPQAYTGQARLKIPQLVQQDFKTLWPPELYYVGAYEWLSDKLSGGRYTDLLLNTDMSLDLMPDAGGEYFELDDLSIDFAFEDMAIAYRDPLQPVTGAKGRGTFDYTSEMVRIVLDEAKVGALSVGHADIEMAHIIESKHGWADILVELEGALPDVFKYLQAAPISFDSGYDLSRMKGDAKLRVNMQLPTFGNVTMDDVAIDVRGTVKKALLPKLVQDIDVTAATARVVIDGNDVHVKGDGKMLGQSVAFDYESFLYSKGKPFKERVRFDANTDEALRSRFGADLSAFLSGDLALKGEYVSRPDNTQSLTATANLQRSFVFVEPLGYQKPVGALGKASFTLDMAGHTPVRLHGLDVSAQDLDLRGAEILFAPETGALASGQVNNAVVGETVGAVQFTVDAFDRYKLEADLKRFDMRALLAGDEAKKGQGGKDAIALIASVKADEMLTHKGKRVKNGQVYADIDSQGRFTQLELDGSVGSGAIYLRYKPNLEGVRTFRFEADDAGATLAAFGLYPYIRGGKILIHAEPSPQSLTDRNLLGVAELSDFRVVEAPTLAKLLSLASIEGFAKGVSQEGIAFKRLETQFDWVYKPEGSLIVLEKGGTSGAAVGLTFDGIIDQGAGTIDLSGTVVPMSQVNNVIGSIPLIGNILTGGSGVFAATYKVEGKAKDPEISINPLSVLAPGILRRILFE